MMQINFVGNALIMSIPIAGMSLSLAVLLPYKDTKIATADLRQQAHNIKDMKIKLAIIALFFCGISIVYHSCRNFYLDLYSIAYMLPEIALLCLSIAMLFPYKKTAEISSSNTPPRLLKN